MKISYNPKSSQTAITTETAANDDIIFDLYTSKLWAKGVRIGADWADISSKPSSLKNPEAIKFKDINGKEVSYDGSTAKDLTTGTYIAKLPYGFAAFVPNPTWGNTNGTSIASWNDSNGGSIDFRKDNPSSGKMSIKVDGRVYVNEGANPVLSAEYGDGFWGMRTPDGVNDYIKTPNYGLIPCVPGNAGSGHSTLGTSTWYFSAAYIDKVYGSLKGNADTATTATTALKADKLTTARNIALGTDLKGSANFDGSGNITINATINSCFVTMGNTDKLPFKRIAHYETKTSWDDLALLLYINQGYVGGCSGICRVAFRTNDISQNSTSITAQATVGWLVRDGYNLGSLYAGYYVTTGKAYIDIYLKTTGGYQGTAIRVLQDGRYGIYSHAQLIDARYVSDTDHKEAYSSIEDASQALYNRAYTRIVSGSDIGTVGNSTGNSGSATKLQTARSLWGNLFDGTKDINDSIRNLPIGGGIYWNPHVESSGDDSGSASIALVRTGIAGGTTLVLSQMNDVSDTIQFRTNVAARLYHNNDFILTSKDTKVTSGKGYINNIEITQVDNATNASSANKLNKWFSSRVTDLNQQFGDGALRIFNATSSTTDNKCPTDASILHLAWDNNGGWDSQLAIGNIGTNIYFRGQNGGAWSPWRTVLHDGNSSISGSTITINGSSLKLNIANWDTAYNFVSTITGTDTDNVINKWDEIVNFLAGITEDNKLNTLLNSKLSVYKLADETNVSTIKNNGIYYSTTDASSSTLTNSPFYNGFALINMTSYDVDNDLKRSRLAFNGYGEIKVSDDRDEANTAETWYNVLTSKNSGIDGSTIKLNGTSITVYSSGTADGRYVKKTGDTMSGALNFANATWNQVGDDVAIGDHNIAGCLGIKGLNGNPGLAFYDSSNTLLSKLVGTTSQLQRVSGDNTYTIIDTASPYITNGVYVFDRSEIGTSPNYDNPGKNGLFEIRSSSEVTGETGTRPNIGYGAFLNLKTPDNIAMLQMVGIDNTLYFRNRQSASVTMTGIPWKKVLDTGNSYVKDGKGVINNTTIIQVDNATNADTIDGEHASAFTRIVGRHSIATTGTAPYNYIHLFRIANNNGYSTIDCEVDLRTRYHSAKLEIRITTSKPQYGNNGSNMSIIKKVINGRSCNFWFLETVQSSGYNYYDIYYQSWAWDGGTYDIILKGSNGVLVFEHKGINLDTLPDNVSIVNNQWVMWNDIAGKPSSFTPAAHNHDGRYLRLDGSDTMQGNLNLYSYGGGSYIGRGSGDKSGADFTEANIVIRSWWGISFKSFDDVVRTYIDTRTGNIGTKGKLISTGFIHSGVTDTKNANQYVLTADGGYTFLNQTSNELAHEFDVSIAVTSKWKDIEDFYGGNQGFLTQPGTYIVQVYYKDASADGMYEGYFSGIMSWYTGETNSNNADEIVLHRVGHAYANTIYLRTRESLSSEEKPYTKLQISANSDLKQHTYKFKFKRIC